MRAHTQENFLKMRDPIIKNAGKKVKMRDFSRNAGLSVHPDIVYDMTDINTIYYMS